MTYEEFCEKAWSDLCDRIDAHERWLCDENQAWVAVGPHENQRGLPEWPKPTGFSVSYWTGREMRRHMRNNGAADIDYSSGAPKLKLFGLPVEERDGLEEYDITITPEAPK